MRANLLDEVRKPYVVTARARGLPENRVILKYPVRVALNPFASTLGYLFPHIVSGSIIVSVVLSLPTLGPVLLGSLAVAGYVSGWHDRTAYRRHDRHRHANLRPCLATDRSPHSAGG